MLKSVKLLSKYGVRLSVLENLLTHLADFKNKDYVNHSETYGTPHAFRVLFYVLAQNSHSSQMGSTLTGILIEAAKYHTLGMNPGDPSSDYGCDSFKRMQELGVWGKDCTLCAIQSKEPMIKELVQYIVENHCKSEAVAYSNVKLYPLLANNSLLAIELMKTFRDCTLLAKGKLTDAEINSLQVPYSSRLANISEHVYTTLLQ